MNILEKYYAELNRDPDRIMIMSEFKQLRFSDIELESNRIKNYLIENRISEIVGVCISNSRYYLSVILGIFKSGRIFYPISCTNDNTKCANVALYLHIITDNEQTDEKKKNLSDILNYNPVCETYNIRPNNIAYILSTSGTTGNPKNVVITHNNLEWLLNEYYKIIPFKQEDIYLLTTPYTFDVFFTEIFSSILGQGCLFIPEGLQTMGQFRRIGRIINECHITHISLPPSVGKLLLASDIQYYNSLKFVIFAGEALELNILRSFFSRVSEECKIYNMYGPTETTIYCTYAEMFRNTEEISIGEPIPGAKIIIDSNGELLIGGRGVTNGYWNNKELTNKSFIEINNERFYKSGDLGTEKNGMYYCLGRNDNQIKVNGIRIELDEISEKINQVLGGKYDYQIIVYNNRMFCFIKGLDVEAERRLKISFKDYPEFKIPIIVPCATIELNKNRKFNNMLMLQKYYFKPKQQRTSDKNIKILERMLINEFKVQSIQDLDSLAKILFLVRLEEEYGINIDDSTLYFEDALQRVLEEITNKGNDKEKETVCIEIIPNIYTYTENELSKRYYQTFYTQKHYERNKFYELETCELLLPRVNDEQNKQFLLEFCKNIEIFNLVLYHKNAQIYFRKADNLYLPIVVGNVKIDQKSLTKKIHERDANLLYYIVLNSSEKKAIFLISHYIVDKASINMIKKEWANFLTHGKANGGSYLNYIENITRKCNAFYDNKLLEDFLNVNKIKSCGNLIHNLRYFVLPLPEKNTSIDISLQVSYLICKMIFLSQELNAKISGTLIANIREIGEGREVRNIIGDIHSTIPFICSGEMQYQDFIVQNQNIIDLVKNGINYKLLIYRHYPNEKETKEYKAFEYNTSFSVNYLGAAKSFNAAVRSVNEFANSPKPNNNKIYITAFTYKYLVYVFIVDDLFLNITKIKEDMGLNIEEFEVKN